MRTVAREDADKSRISAYSNAVNGFIGLVEHKGIECQVAYGGVEKSGQKASCDYSGDGFSGGHFRKRAGGPSTRGELPTKLASARIAVSKRC